MPKCEKCRERAATVFIKRVLDAQSTQSRLCEECAREQAISQAWLAGALFPPRAEEMPLEELLPELLSSAPDPEAFAPAEDQWSLQKLAAYDQLKAQGEFSSDEDLADDMDDEMDDEDAAELSSEEFEAALEDMEPGEREAVSQMLEALDEVQEHLEHIMFQHAQDLDGAPEEAGAQDEDDALPSIQAFFQSELTRPGEADPFADGSSDSDPFADEPEDEDSHEALEGPAEQDEQSAEGGEALLPTFLLPGFLGFDERSGPPQPAGAPAFKSAPAQRCPRCRMTWDRLREDGRAGCPTCYETFEETLGETMERGPSGSHHIGKAPRSALRRQRRLELLRARRDSRLALLRERLKAALEAQQFEEAAKLRDKIKVVESTIVEPGE